MLNEQPPESSDLSELIAGLNEAVERLELWVFDGGTAPLPDRIRAHDVLHGLIGRSGRLTSATDVVDESLLADMDPDTPTVVDGRAWRPERRSRWVRWDTESLRRTVTTWAQRDRLDAETGELVAPSTAEILDDLWKLAEVARGRTKQLRNAGIELSDYAEWEPKWTVVEVIPEPPLEDQ